MINRSACFPGIMYDAEKEERQLQDARQRELLRIEETKQKAAQLGQTSAWFASYFYFRPVTVLLLNPKNIVNLCKCIPKRWLLCNDLSLLTCAARPKMTNGAWWRCCCVAQAEIWGHVAVVLFSVVTSFWGRRPLDALPVVLHCWLRWHEPDVFCCTTCEVMADMQTWRHFPFLFSPFTSAELLHVIRHLISCWYLSWDIRDMLIYSLSKGYFVKHSAHRSFMAKKSIILAEVLGWLLCLTRFIRLIIVSIFTDDPALEKQDTFVEKLVTQVIKNLQVKISNIHVRYEDDVSHPPPSNFTLLSPKQVANSRRVFFTQVTNPNCPLSFGVSLKNLSLQVTSIHTLT